MPATPSEALPPITTRWFGWSAATEAVHSAALPDMSTGEIRSDAREVQALTLALQGLG